MTLFSCSVAPVHLVKEGENWDCGSTRVCGFGSKYRRLYTWALNAQGIKFPDGVGIKIGGESGYDVLVIQVHYNHLPKDDEPSDNTSSYKMTLTTQEYFNI